MTNDRDKRSFIEQQVTLQFNRRASFYGSTHPLANTSDLEAVFKGLSLNNKMRVLDVACGGGHCAVFCAKQNWEVVACDLASEMLKETSKLAAIEGVPLQTVLASAEMLPFDDRSFDLVTCRVAAHHFSDIPQFVCEAHRVLKTGGRLVIIDGASPADSEAATKWLQKVEKLRDPSHVYFWNKDEWRHVVEEQGFEIELLEESRLLQPDLEHYFDIADTADENRDEVLALVKTASDEVRRVMQLEVKDGLITWWWPRITLRAIRREDD